MKSIIIYYSKAGNTEKLAKKIQADTSSDILKVEPKESYGSFIPAVARVVKERKANAAVEVVTEIPDLEEYDVVFVGYPIWGSTVPSFLLDFLGKCDLDGKKIIPFATSGASNIRGSLEDVRNACAGAKVGLPLGISMLRKDNYSQWLEKVQELLEEE